MEASQLEQVPTAVCDQQQVELASALSPGDPERLTCPHRQPERRLLPTNVRAHARILDPRTAPDGSGEEAGSEPDRRRLGK
jgi:hypothetical protein